MKQALATVGILAFASAAAGAQAAEQRHQLFRFTGAEPFDEHGRSAVVLDDLDGDGRAEVAVGSPRSFAGEAGEVRVYRGSNGALLYTVPGSAPADGLTDRFGTALAAIGDLDGDGRSELAIGAPWDDEGGSQSGACLVVSGSSGVALALVPGDTTLGEFGGSLEAVGDVNGDGVRDFAVGAGRSGGVRMVSGEWVRSTGLGVLPQTGPFLWATQLVGDGGAALASVGDLNGDGRPELAVGQPRVEGAPGAPAGRISILDGAGGAVLGSFAGSAGEEFGHALGSVGDLGGDGFAELAVGAPGAAGGGSLRLFDGASLAALVGSSGFPVELWRADGGAGVKRFGLDVTTGDWDGDGVTDVASSALEGPGASGFVRGLDGAGLPLFELAGEELFARLGWSLASGGDVNGDGGDDLVVGAPRAGDGSQGALRVYSGIALGLTASGHEISVDTGGVIDLSLDGGAQVSGLLHLVLGTSTGTSPGTPTPVGLLPLNVDAYMIYTLSPRPELPGFIGFFDSAGASSAQISLPTPLNAGLIGLQLHYAWLALDLSQPIAPNVAVSNEVAVRFVSDSCSVIATAVDCNANGSDDACDISEGVSQDCNGNGIPDECDLAAGTSLDLDHDGLPDECQSDRYVNPAAVPGGDGSSWASAHHDLQVALSASAPYDRLWLAQGTYRVLGDNDSFVVPTRRSIYGGFGGFETAIEQRDPVAFPTVLSGDVFADDGPDYLNATENAFTVVTVPDATGRDTVIDGITISGGYADEFGPCNFWGVFSVGCKGGGLNCLGEPRFRNCIFENNFGGLQGGAVFCPGDPTFENCTFRNNDAFAGGAVFTDIGGAPLFVNCVFLGNDATEGGAMASVGASSDGPRGVGCLFLGNRALVSGGALWALDVAPSFTGCTFHANDSQVTGGATFGVGTAQISMTNSIVWGNTAAGSFGEAASVAGIPPSFVRCLVEGWTGTLDGAATNGGNPQFLDPLGPDGIVGTGDENLRLGPGSAGIDNGNDLGIGMDETDLDRDGDVTEPVPFDHDGTLRQKDDPAVPDNGIGTAPVVDRGAYET